MPSINTPILLLIFNRPDTTQRVMEVIKKVKPNYLYVAADGPRVDNELDTLKCEEARKTVIQNIDWDCKLITLFRDKNLGCRTAVSSSISWFFKNEVNGIILEDDTLPHPSFFLYCQTMLERYKHDERVMHISGNNFQNGILRGNGNYYFSKYPHIWGWATWRRAWSKYDVELTQWPLCKDSIQFKKWCFSQREKTYWSSIFDNTYNGAVDTWDFQWVFSILKNAGLCVMPNQNLVANIGFRSDATHTIKHHPQLADKPVSEYKLPDVTSCIAINKEADLYTLHTVFFNEVTSDKQTKLAFSVLSSLLQRIKKKVNQLYF
jgi:hypothetical protein